MSHTISGKLEGSHTLLLAAHGDGHVTKTLDAVLVIRADGSCAISFATKIDDRTVSTADLAQAIRWYDYESFGDLAGAQS